MKARQHRGVPADEVSIADLPNLGPVTTGRFSQVGIQTLNDLRRVGAIGAYRILQTHGFNPSINLLYAVAAALRGIHWQELSTSEKTALRKQLQA